LGKLGKIFEEGELYGVNTCNKARMIPVFIAQGKRHAGCILHINSTGRLVCGEFYRSKSAFKNA
jgi:hypothetical protein